ncbi:MAG: nitroreductase family protein [Anaerolineae bacterium]|nr:nitroreductase family protein [Anaerolineae bacterium]
MGAKVDAIEVIMTRRSIRHYTPQPVSEELIEKVLRGAMAAPSARNEQSWQFVVINDREILNVIPKYHQFSEMLREVPLAIVVCGDVRRESHRDYWQQNCAAATQNLLLTAHALDLGAVWLGLYPREDRVAKTQALLGLPEGVIPMAIVALGYPAEEKSPSDRFDPAKVHRNRW